MLEDTMHGKQNDLKVEFVKQYSMYSTAYRLWFAQ